MIYSQRRPMRCHLDVADRLTDRAYVARFLLAMAFAWMAAILAAAFYSTGGAATMEVSVDTLKNVATVLVSLGGTSAAAYALFRKVSVDTLKSNLDATTGVVNTLKVGQAEQDRTIASLRSDLKNATDEMVSLRRTNAELSALNLAHQATIIKMEGRIRDLEIEVSMYRGHVDPASMQHPGTGI